jgi:2-polyprenyl-3-methyl-5-hydroxy-6-metoxy-1,4-benzoquinol methylase
MKPSRVISALISPWLRQSIIATGDPAKEKGPDYYDMAFHENENMRAHYTNSRYYFLWTVIIDRMRRAQSKSVLELGCGAGQLAHALHDAGAVERYYGLDFSKARIEQARRNCPTFKFDVADVCNTGSWCCLQYDSVIATEFLEHVEGDLEILAAIRPGTRFIGSVPNFPYVSHVRHFTTAEAVTDRYGELFDDLQVVFLMGSDRGNVFFLLDGVRHSRELVGLKR